MEENKKNSEKEREKRIYKCECKSSSKEEHVVSNIEDNMTDLNNRYADTLNHFNYTREYMNKKSCLLSPRPYGALFLLQFRPPTSKCRITVDYGASEDIMVIDFDPDYPISMTHFIHGQKQRKKLDQ